MLTMPRHEPRAILSFLIATPLVLAAASLVLGKEKEIDPNFIALKDCPLEQGCAALILLDETVLSNESQQARVSRRQVLKLFTDEGIQKYADVEVSTFAGDQDIRNLDGRTIQPDGTVTPLKQENVFVKTAAKQGRYRLRTKTAKFPGVVPGTIIDYSFDLVSTKASNYTEYTWNIQKSLPVITSRFIVKQGELNFATMMGGSQHVDVVRSTPFKKITQFTATNVPSIPSEPLGPPEEAIRARMYLYLSELSAGWLAEVAGRLAGATGEYIGDAQLVHAKVKELVAEQDSATQKVRKIYDFVQQKIGTEEQRAGLTQEGQAEDPNDIDEVLQRGYGDDADRTLLFIAMAREAGLQAGILYLVPRGDGIFNPDTPDEDQFGAFAAAVKTSGSSWTFYDPAVKHCPFGMISAHKEGGVQNGILFAPQKGAGEIYAQTLYNTIIPRHRQVAYSLAAIPFSAAAKNVLMREASVKLSADGSAEVETTDQGSGQVDLAHRRVYEDLGEDERRTTLLERLHEVLPRAQLASCEFIDIGSFEKPAVIKYRFTVPEVASGVADRIILTPSLFNAAKPTPFTTEKRITPVHFRHTQKTMERLTFEIPAGYTVVEMPKADIIREGPFVLVTNYTVSDGKLVFSRRLEIDAAIWSVEAYPQLKSFFQRVQEADRQVVVLKKESA